MEKVTDFVIQDVPEEMLKDRTILFSKEEFAEIRRHRQERLAKIEKKERKLAIKTRERMSKNPIFK
jgi:hypothetical protein